MRPEPMCAYCRRRPVDPAWRPFCSERCKLIDLGAWAAEKHAIPGSATEAEEEKPKTEDEESGP